MSLTHLYLASSSPRRQHLLMQMGYHFTQVQPDVIEKCQDNESAYQYVARLAKEKALSGLEQIQGQGTVLGADTLIAFQGEIFEKPEGKEDFRRMMQQLSGKTHEVLTAVALATENDITVQTVSTQVKFCVLTEAMIEAYWNTKEPVDKAGGYAIQGSGGCFVECINGSYSSVVGLPCVETRNMLLAYGIQPDEQNNDLFLL